MDIREKLYQMFILGLEGDGYKEALKSSLGGVIFLQKILKLPNNLKNCVGKYIPQQ